MISHPIALSWRLLPYDITKSIPKGKDRIWVDYDKIGASLTLGYWEEGDWFIPFGMKGRKKLSDFFTDLKLSRREKESTPILRSGSEIVWVIGHRLDDRFCVSSSTTHVLELSVS